jgi:AbrB family looped-hinge helix DNA binding protein
MPAPLVGGDSLRGAERSPIRYPYISGQVRRLAVDVSARLTSKGQVTIPRSVREALGLGDGDHVVFRVEGHRAVMARTPDLLDLAGAVDVPASKRGVAWDEVRRRTRAARPRSSRLARISLGGRTSTSSPILRFSSSVPEGRLVRASSVCTLLCSFC